jgi:hypothetical protein
MDLPLPHDFKEFLVLLNSEKIDYLIVGGYAVSYHGYPRPTGDLDVWVAMHPETATKLVDALAKFGFASAGATKDLFLTPGRVVRMGVPPVRIEVLSSISGVDFASCHARRIDAVDLTRFDGHRTARTFRAEVFNEQVRRQEERSRTV